MRKNYLIITFSRIRRSSLRGFTLVELLIYMGILSLLIGVLSVLFGSILDVQMDSQSTSSVDQDARYIQARMIYDMQRGTNIVAPAAIGTPAPSMQIAVGLTNYTYSVDANNNLILTDGAGPKQLNSADTSITNVSFVRIGDGDADDTVRVTYTVVSDIQEVSGQESRTVQTTLGLQ